MVSFSIEWIRAKGLERARPPKQRIASFVRSIVASNGTEAQLHPRLNKEPKAFRDE